MSEQNGDSSLVSIELNKTTISQEDLEARNMEKKTHKNTIDVVNNLLLSKSNTIIEQDSINFYAELNTRLQRSYREFYEEKLGIKSQIIALVGTEDADMEALRIISEIARSGDEGWTATFPNLKSDGKGMDCTLSSAMLHAALDDLGYVGISSTLRLGHYVVTRVMSDGSIKLYDPATSTTKDGITSAYSRMFKPEEVTAIDTDEGNGNKGKKLEIVIDEQDEPGGFHEQSADGKYRKSFYASSPDTYLDMSVALENIDSLRKDSKTTEIQLKESTTTSNIWTQQATQIVSTYPQILGFDYGQIKSENSFFDPHDVI